MVHTTKERMMDKLTKLQNQVKDAFAHLDAQEIQQETAYILETADMVMHLHKNPIEGKSTIKEWGMTLIATNQYIAMNKLLRERGIDRDMMGTILYEKAHAATRPADANITEMALKPVRAKHEKRNYRIAKKLLEENVEQFNFNDQEIIWGNGFETTWKVQDLLVTLKVIFAGGYNIQRYHPRILVNVKKINKEVA